MQTQTKSNMKKSAKHTDGLSVGHDPLITSEPRVDEFTPNNEEKLRRIVDIALSLFGMLLLAPVYLAVAILIKFQGPGDLIFKQTRIGRGGKKFLLYKFRKFPVDVSTGTNVTMCGDVRMTSFGAFLERTKLDELPQLWNVFKGDITFVGWRPESMAYAHLYSGEHEEVLKYMPGILGPWQVTHRTESDLYPIDCDPEEYYKNTIFPAKARMDLEYQMRRNLFKDMVLLIRGVWVTFAGMVKWREFLEQKGSQLLLDWFLLDMAWFIAHLIRFMSIPKADQVQLFYYGLVIIPGFSLLMMISGGCYKSIHRYYTVSDLLRLARNLFFGLALAYITMVVLNRSASIVVMTITAVISVNLLALPRLNVRRHLTAAGKAGVADKKKTLIYGDNSLAALLVNWVRSEAKDIYDIKGILSSSSDNHGSTINGVTIIGGVSQIENMISVTPLDELWITKDPGDHEWIIMKELAEKHGMKIINLAQLTPFSRLMESTQKEKK